MPASGPSLREKAKGRPNKWGSAFSKTVKNLPQPTSTVDQIALNGDFSKDKAQDNMYRSYNPT